MSSIPLTRTARSSGIHCTNLLRYRLVSLQFSRFASLNTAIAKGLRKSQGLGFRGKEWSKDSRQPSVRQDSNGTNGIVRRYDGHTPRPQIATGSWPSRFKPTSHTKPDSAYAYAAKRDTSDRSERKRDDSARSGSSSSMPYYRNDPYRATGRKAPPQATGRFLRSDRNLDQRTFRPDPNLRSEGGFIAGVSRPFKDPADGRPPRTIKSRAAREEAEAREFGASPSVRIHVGKREIKEDSWKQIRLGSDRRNDDRETYLNLSQRVRSLGGDTSLPRPERKRVVREFTRSTQRDLIDISNGYGDSQSRDEVYDNRKRHARDGGQLGNEPPTSNLGGIAAPPPRIDKNIPISVEYTTPASVFLYGTSTVEAALRSTHNPRRKLYKLYVYNGAGREDADKDEELSRLAKRQRIRVQKCDNNLLPLLDKMSGGRPHNGYILEASPLPQLPITCLGPPTHQEGIKGFSVKLAHQSREEEAVNGTNAFSPTIWAARTHNPLVLFLDSIKDPGNLGGIIRTANFLGVSAIVISTRSSSPITPIVIKASAGATEDITIFAVKDVNEAEFVTRSRENGWRVYAATAPSSVSKSSTRRPRVLTTDELIDPLRQSPCLLLLGSEGEGLRGSISKQAEFHVSVSGMMRRGAVDSMNVSVAAGVLCSAFLRKMKRDVSAESADSTSHVAPDANETEPSGDRLF